MYRNNVSAVSSNTSSYEIANKKLMGSFDPVMDPTPDNYSSEGSNANKMYRVNMNILPIFFVEFVSLACLGALAYVFRFTQTFPVLIRGFHCDHINAYSFPRNVSQDFYDSPANVRPVMLYSVSLALPIGLILVGELFYFIFSRKKKVVRASCVPCKLYLPLRRITRFTGVYLFGYFALSILVDSLKVCTGRLRPYFLEVCQPVNFTETNSCYGQYQYPACDEREDVVREARMSFPSYYAAASSYSALFCMIYLNFLLSFQASRLLRPSVTFLLASVAILCGTLRVSFHFNHWEDVAVGFVFGIVTAIYLIWSILHGFQEDRWDLNVQEHTDNEPLFFKYFRIPHASCKNRNGPNYHTEAPTSNLRPNNGLYKANTLQNPDFQKDLHKRIEDFSKRQSLQ